MPLLKPVYQLEAGGANAVEGFLRRVVLVAMKAAYEYARVYQRVSTTSGGESWRFLIPAAPNPRVAALLLSRQAIAGSGMSSEGGV